MNNEKTVSTGYRTEKSMNGYTLDVLKSALQKYIRRGEEQKALWSGLELDFFDCFEGGKRIYTNFIHRLMIIYLEDIGLGAISIWKELDNLFDKLLIEDNTTKEKLTPKPERTRIICDIISTLSMNKHSRIPSHYKSIYNSYENYLQYKPYLDSFSSIRDTFKSLRSQEKEVEDGGIDIIIKKYKSSLKDKNIEALFWSSKIYDSQELKPIQKMNIIFDNLEEVINKNFKDFITLGKKWYRELDLKERFLTYYIPLLLYLLGEYSQGEMYLLPEGRWKKLVLKNLFHKRNEFDDFVFDMHTKFRKKGGGEYTQFIKEGSHVENEFLLKDDEYKRFYNFGKIFIFEGKVEEEYLKKDEEKREKESDRYSFIIRAQLVTSAHKQDTYFAKDKSNEKIVFVKGPYPNEEKPNNVIWINNLKRLLGLRYIPAKIRWLIPDLLQSPLSSRNSTFKNEIYPFLEFENVCREEFAVKIKESKLWEKTEVVDWDKMKTCKVFNPLEASNDLIRDYTTFLIFRKLVGIGDQADRNFILVDNKTLYSVDEDTVNTKVNIFEDIKRKRTELVKDYIGKNLTYFQNLLKDWRIKLEKSREELGGIDTSYLLKEIRDFNLNNF